MYKFHFRSLKWLFLAILIIESLGIIYLTESFGALKAAGFIFFSVLLGIYILKKQSFSLLQLLKQQNFSYSLDIKEINERFIKILAGCLFIFPGILTDIFACILFFSPLRRIIFMGLLKFFCQKELIPPASQSIIELKGEEYKNLP